MNTSDFLLLSIVTFVLIDFGAGMVINYLNENSKNAPLSAGAAEIYNPDEYARSMEYGTAKYKFEMLTSVITTIVILSAIILGWFAKLDLQIRERIENNLLVTIVFVGILIVVSSLSSIPGRYYSTFVIEEKYGFNKKL